MVRSFTFAALVVAFVSVVLLLTASVAPAQPRGRERSKAEAQQPQFPVPQTPAPEGFEYGKIDWQGWLAEARKEDRIRTGALPDGAIVRAEGVTPTLPLLLPAEPNLIRSMQIFVEPNSYSATGDIARANVTIYGTHVFRVRAANDPIMRAAEAAPHETLSNGLEVRITTAEAGINLTFTRWGAAYLISVECEDPTVDKRCSDSRFIKSLAEKMAIAG